VLLPAVCCCQRCVVASCACLPAVHGVVASGVLLPAVRVCQLCVVASGVLLPAVCCCQLCVFASCTRCCCQLCVYCVPASCASIVSAKAVTWVLGLWRRVTAEWSPDGRRLLTATTAPRLNVDNGFKIWR
jgi:hypothetical protein